MYVVVLGTYVLSRSLGVPPDLGLLASCLPRPALLSFAWPPSTQENTPPDEDHVLHSPILLLSAVLLSTLPRLYYPGLPPSRHVSLPFQSTPRETSLVRLRVLETTSTPFFVSSRRPVATLFALLALPSLLSGCCLRLLCLARLREAPTPSCLTKHLRSPGIVHNHRRPRLHLICVFDRLRNITQPSGPRVRRFTTRQHSFPPRKRLSSVDTSSPSLDSLERLRTAGTSSFLLLEPTDARKHSRIQREYIRHSATPVSIVRASNPRRPHLLSFERVSRLDIQHDCQVRHRGALRCRRRHGRGCRQPPPPPAPQEGRRLRPYRRCC